MSKKIKYIITPKVDEASSAVCRQLALDLEIPQILAELIYQRGFTTLDDVKSFLNPKLADLPSPFGLKDVSAAVDLLAQAVSQKQQVVIHGDYDVDGITATALLMDFFARLNLEVIYHLPNRMTDGYGLTMNSIDKLAEKVKMPALLITVDCGITAVKEVQYANKLGFKVIVTDHHEPSRELPSAHAVINPKQTDCSFGCKGLSGVGVVFFLVMAIRRKMVENGFWTMETMPNLRNYLDFVALGTVADVMELAAENRILVKSGLEVISEKNRIGIQMLCECAGVKDGKVTSEDISFRLAPRINAAGRVGTPELAAKLLLSKKPDQSKKLATALEQANNERKELEIIALEGATKQAEQQVEENMNGLVLYGSDWHPGVIGIIASRMVDRFQLPTLVFTDDTTSIKDIVKGSGRSVPGLNLFRVLGQAAYIEQFGGHPMAAGLTLFTENLDLFKEEFSKQVAVERGSGGCDYQNSQTVDRLLDDSINFEELSYSLKLMEPFGQGNPEPVFLLKNIQMQDITLLREHLKFAIQVNGKRFSGIGFFMADHFEIASGLIDFSFRLKQTSFRGRERVEVHAVGISPTS